MAWTNKQGDAPWNRNTTPPVDCTLDRVCAKMPPLLVVSISTQESLPYESNSIDVMFALSTFTSGILLHGPVDPS